METKGMILYRLYGEQFKRSTQWGQVTQKNKDKWEALVEQFLKNAAP